MSTTPLIYGRHAVRAALQARPGDVQELWVQTSNKIASVADIVAQAEALGIAVQQVTAGTLRQHTRDATHQGVAIRMRAQPAWSEQDLSHLVKEDLNAVRLLVLDEVTDPQNLGACLRVAEAAGVRAVIATKRHQAKLSGSVFKAASGAAERVPLVRVANLARVLEQLKEWGVWLYAAAADASDGLWETDFQMPFAIVVGSEGGGLRQRTRALCDFAVRIPMHGHAESLNVATAAGILLFEASRQHSS